MEEDMRSGFCVHCGSKIINEPKITGKVTIDKTDDIRNHLKMAKNALKDKDWETASKLVDSVLLMDSDCLDAWCMKALLSFRDKKQYDAYAAKIENEELNSYGIFSKDDIKGYWGEYTITVSVKNSRFKVPLENIEITLDDKDTINIGNGAGIFGTDPGEHTFKMIEKGKFSSNTFVGEYKFTAKGNDHFAISLKSGSPPTLKIESSK